MINFKNDDPSEIADWLMIAHPGSSVTWKPVIFSRYIVVFNNFPFFLPFLSIDVLNTPSGSYSNEVPLPLVSGGVFNSLNYLYGTLSVNLSFSAVDPTEDFTLRGRVQRDYIVTEDFTGGANVVFQKFFQTILDPTADGFSAFVVCDDFDFFGQAFYVDLSSVGTTITFGDIMNFVCSFQGYQFFIDGGFIGN